MKAELPSATAHFIKRNEKVVHLRIRIMNLEKVTSFPEPKRSRLYEILYERTRAKALLYMDFCRHRKWVWDLVDDLDGVI